MSPLDLFIAVVIVDRAVSLFLIACFVSTEGMQSENGGVVGMLEVIESDFARLESDTKAAEDSAAKEYAEFMSQRVAPDGKKRRGQLCLTSRLLILNFPIPPQKSS